MPNDQDVAIIPIASDYFLTTEISALEATVVEAARRTVERDMSAQNVVLTDTERNACITVQVLKELNSVDLATLLLRYKYYKKIRDNNFQTRHPGSDNWGGSLTVLANQQSISTTELSRIIDLVEIIFPYMRVDLGLDIPTIWKEIGKSNFSDMIPVLKVLITGQDADHSQQANNAAERFLADIEAGYVAQGIEPPDEDILRREAVSDIVEHGRMLNNRELRTHIRPERTPNIDSYLFTRNGRNYILASLDDDQMTMLSRRVGSIMDMSREDPGDANRIPVVRTFLEMLGLL